MFGLAGLFYQQLRAGEEEAGRVYEAVIGVVTDIKDPSKLARVRVKFPSLSMQDESWWATVVMPGAGKDRGWFTLPEVGDEVVCVFEHGEIHRPVVIGALWNRTDKAVDANGGDNERRQIVSRTGHKLVLDDQARSITISDGGGVGTIELSEAGVTLTAKQGAVGLQAKDELAIVAGEIAIKGTAVDLMGKATGVDASATAQVKIQGNLVALKGATIDINPGGVPKAAKADGTVSGDGEDAGPSGGSAGGGGGSSGGGGGSSGGAGGGGSGGGGSGGGSGGGRAVGPGPSPPPAPTPPPEAPLPRTSVEVKVVDKAGKPIGGVRYELRPASGDVRGGVSDPEGVIREDDLEPGTCELTLTELDDGEWSIA